MDHATIRTYIHTVAAQLRKAGIAVAGVHIDTPEQAAECRREYARIDLAAERPVQSLVWADYEGWLTATHADHFPLQASQIFPDPADLAREVASHIHTLAHGGYLKALLLS